MTSISKNIIAVSTILLFLTFNTKPVQAQSAGVSFQIFYDQLDPYGEWVNDPDYGYIWLPDVNGDFQPYATNGYWVNTQYGNTWYSNYDWGWAPFHYGRWIYTDYYGWAWIPGYEWGPAWVSWRQGGGQYGWAPLGPGMSFNVNINIPLRNWIFVPQRYLFSNNIYRYYTPHRRYATFYNRTTIINNVYVYNNHRYYSGPDRRSLERATRNQVTVREVRNNTRPGRSSINSNSLAIYRPNISEENNKSARPSRVVSVDKVNPRSNRQAIVNDNKVADPNNNRVSNGNRAATTDRATRIVSPSENRTQSNNRVQRNTREQTSPSNTRPNRNATATQATTPNTSSNQNQGRANNAPVENSRQPRNRQASPEARTNPSRSSGNNNSTQRTAPSQNEIRNRNSSQNRTRSDATAQRPADRNSRINNGNARTSESKASSERGSSQNQRSSRTSRNQ